VWHQFTAVQNSNTMYAKADLNATLATRMVPKKKRKTQLLVKTSSKWTTIWEMSMDLIQTSNFFFEILQVNFQKFSRSLAKQKNLKFSSIWYVRALRSSETGCGSTSHFRTFQGSDTSNAEFEIFCLASGNCEIYGNVVSNAIVNKDTLSLGGGYH